MEPYRRLAKRGYPGLARTGEALALDIAALEALVGSDTSIHRRLLDKFIGNLPVRRDAVLAACGAGDTKAIFLQAHTLKSSARAVGANPLGTVCEAMEMAGKGGDLAQCQALAAAFEAAAMQAGDAVRLYLASMS